MRKTFFAFVLTISLLAPTAVFAQTVKISPAERKMAEEITAAQLSSYLHFVASDAMGGRDTPSMGLDITAEFIRMNLQKWGFKGAGDNGSFFQKIELSSETRNAANTSLRVGTKSFVLNTDFYRVEGSTEASGQLVFGKDGWMIKSKGMDSLSGIDVTGKIVVFVTPNSEQRSFTPRPPGITDDDVKGTKGVDWADPVTNAVAKGAAGVIIVSNPAIQGLWPQLRGILGRGASGPTKLRQEAAPAVPIPVALVSKAVGDELFAGESVNPEGGNAVAMTKSATLSFNHSKENKWTQNVVALWEGSDPVLKNEMVAIGAHYDHVGTNPNAPGDDKIWNGADDDGSGTVAVLAIAEALARSKTRPKRSILLVWHAGEEKGLWGANYFNKFPTVDIKNVVAQLNIDMIGRSLDPNNVIKCGQGIRRCNENLTKANEIYVIGSEMMSSTLGAITKGTNDAFLKLDYNYKYDDPNDTERFFFRSDHFHYAVNGIPIVFWFDGVHEDYHQASDTADKIDYQKMEKVTRTIFLTMWKLSEMPTRPAVDKQLPPELTRR